LQSEPGEILLLTDITESRQTADLVQRQQRLSAIGEMTARLAHQIRTPLASALLNASQLKLSSNNDRGETVEKITARLNELARMVNDMLRFAGGARAAGDSIVVRELLDSVVDSLSPQAGSDCEICVELDDPALTVTGNRDALKAALLNLASNAIQACAAAPRIELAAVNGRGQVCLTVSDNGQGIPASIRERIFEPFFTTRPQGTGLGLAVVRSIAEAHRGEILLRSGSSGTTFCLCLPVAEEVANGGCPEYEWQPDTPPMPEHAHG
jgi:two-component system sensor histidine kinase FlrB